MGASETTLGHKNLAAEFAVTTKSPTASRGAGKRENIFAAAKESWDALKIEKVRSFKHSSARKLMNFTPRFHSTSSMAPMRRFPSKKPTLQSKLSMKKDASKRLLTPNFHLMTLPLPDMPK
jgi:hypothetical protein